MNGIGRKGQGWILFYTNIKKYRGKGGADWGNLNE